MFLVWSCLYYEARHNAPPYKRSFKQLTSTVIFNIGLSLLKSLITESENMLLNAVFVKCGYKTIKVIGLSNQNAHDGSFLDHLYLFFSADNAAFELMVSFVDYLR